jgi:hypothetical protein
MFGCMGCVVAVALTLHLSGFRLSPWVLQTFPFSLLKQVDKGMLKVAWSTYRKKEIQPIVLFDDFSCTHIVTHIAC